MTALAAILHQQEPITAEQAGHITASWPGLLTSPIETADQCREICAAINALKEPAQPAWIMARVAALLSQYYAADVPAAAVSIMAEDWLEQLREYPQWAITKAVRWWKSKENPQRHKRPLEGDIADRVRREMGVVRVASGAVGKFQQRGNLSSSPDEPERAPPSEASKARIAAMIAGAGLSKRVGGAA